ncbi:MAG: hypothetical protein KIT58_03750 [Planctomycetota bacterium]|nr:hypothetical protein [Planctomycetota bacterium]
MPRVEGYLEHLGAQAEVVLREDGRPVAYTMPPGEFLRLGLREGDRFWVEVLDRGGGPTGRIVPGDPETVAPPPERYLNPDELRASADPWD